MSGERVTASTYLKYLPALYRLTEEAGGDQPFVAVYLKIFEKLLSGITEPAPAKGSPPPPPYLTRKGIRELLAPQVIGTLFHPRLNFLFADDPAVADVFTPPLSLGNASDTGDNEAKLSLLGTYVGAEDTASVKRWLSGFLDWIAGTIALDVDRGWAIDTKRFVIAQALPLFRARGTTDGMNWLLNAWFGMDRDAPIRLAPTRGLKVVSISVGNPSFAPILVLDSRRPDTFVLEDVGGYGVARLPDIVCFDSDPDGGREYAMGYRAWYFVVTVQIVAQPGPLSDEDEAALKHFEAAVEEVVDEFKPALTDFDIEIERIAVPQPLAAIDAVEADDDDPEA